MPTTLTQTSIRPWSATVWLASASTWLRSAASVGTAYARPPAAVISCTVASSARLPRAAQTTVAPAFANLPAAARPIPDEAQSTTTTRPSRQRLMPLGCPAPAGSNARGEGADYGAQAQLTHRIGALLSASVTVPLVPVATVR